MIIYVSEKYEVLNEVQFLSDTDCAFYWKFLQHTVLFMVKYNKWQPQRTDYIQHLEKSFSILIKILHEI